jgi:hypothetical protein
LAVSGAGFLLSLDVNLPPAKRLTNWAFLLAHTLHELVKPYSKIAFLARKKLERFGG